MDTLSPFELIVIGVLLLLIIVVSLALFRPKKCPECGSKMKLMTMNCGKTQKYHCPSCGKRIDTGIPAGRGRR